MASGRVATEPCPACGKDNRHRMGRLCTPCYSRLNVTLGSLPLLAGEAAGRLEPESRTAGVSGRSAPGSRPPVNVDALDPALALIELVQGDSSSRVTILEALESWERLVRAENKLAPYGVASSRHRDPLSTTATLGHVCRFLSVWLEWMSNDEHLDIADFRGHVWAARRVLLRWSWEEAPASRWRVACPSLTVDGLSCGAVLSFVGLDDGEVYCRGCRSRWTPARLLVVAHSTDAESVWVDAEAAAVAVGVDASTVRRWARAGRVRRDGQRYSLADIRSCCGPVLHSGIS